MNKQEYHAQVRRKWRINNGNHISVQKLKGYKGLAWKGDRNLVCPEYRSRIGEQRELAQRIAERVPPGGQVLEVARARATYPSSLQIGKCEVTGLDISETFVKIERQNAAEAGVKIDFNHGRRHEHAIRRKPL